MQTMRYINLLDRASRVRTNRCFVYNNTIFFAVPRNLVSRALGPAAINVRKIQENLGRKIRIVAEPEGAWDAKRFVGDLVSPNKFKSLEIKDNLIILTAGSSQNKAILIGRNKKRLEELDSILQDIFGMALKIV